MTAARDAAPEPQAVGFFVLRTPLLPLSVVTSWGSGLEAAAPAGPENGTETGTETGTGQLAERLAADRMRLRARLEDLVTEPAFREAVFLAAPVLEAAIDQWRKDPDSERGQRAENSLVAYLMRAAARPTPFGLFAGCTTGSIGPVTRLELDGRERYRRHTRLDMDFLWTLANAIEADPLLRADLCYRPNSSLYEVGNRLLYAEARASAAGRSYHLVAVAKTPYLTGVLARAAGGARLAALAAVLTDDEVTDAEARDYLGQLIDSQLLVADCQPPVTGPPPAAEMAAALSRHPATAAIAAQLRQAQGALQALDAHGPGVSPQAYRRLAADLGGLPAAPDPARFLQVDLVKPAVEATLSPAVVTEIQRAVRILHALAPTRADMLADFRAQYGRRYGTREMPLAEVLDEETGIGFPAPGQAADGGPLLAGLPLGSHPARQAAWTKRDAFLHRKLAAALTAGATEIVLGAAEANALRRPDELPLPEAFEAVAVIAAGSAAAVKRGEYQVLVGSVGGPSGARLLGRFCHADAALRELVRDHLRAEERGQPDRVFAEVVHLPQGRTGNILSRPLLRRYEIPYLGRSGAPPGQQIPLADLLVGVRGDRVVLRSRSLGREVVPRLTTAHNYAATGLGVYRFLCALQEQHVRPGVMWDWGPVRDAPFLPRVTSGRAVLARATWNLSEQDLAAFGGHGTELFSAVQQVRTRRQLPRLVALSDTDNELLADLDNVLSIEALAHQVRRRASAALVELWPGPDELCVSGPEGRFVHQVVVPFTRPAAQAQSDPGQLAGRLPPVPLPAGGHRDGAVRQFPPGSEWLYAKLFAGPATADRILLRIAPVVSAWQVAGVIDSWHFIRYGDPDWHLRLRFHGRPGVLLGEVLPGLQRLTEPMLGTGELWRLQLDTYQPEVERYGGDLGIGPAERIFHADSEAVLAILAQVPGDAGDDTRWQLALRGIDQLLDDLGLSLAAKRELARRCKAAYGREFGAGGAFQHAVSGRFRQYRQRLEDVLASSPRLPAQIAGCLPAFDARSAAIAAPCWELGGVIARAADQSAGVELAVSLAHMHVNRLLRSAQRAQELVLYEMLDRLYTSRAARPAR